MGMMELYNVNFMSGGHWQPLTVQGSLSQPLSPAQVNLFTDYLNNESLSLGMNVTHPAAFIGVSENIRLPALNGSVLLAGDFDVKSFRETLLHLEVILHVLIDNVFPFDIEVADVVTKVFRSPLTEDDRVVASASMFTQSPILIPALNRMWVVGLLNLLVTRTLSPAWLHTEHTTFLAFQL